MTFIVRSASGWLKAKPAYLAPIFLLLSLQGAYAQQKLETQQQTNEKIQELAGLAQPQTVETPIGSGDLVHIDVFDVPELSRDVRVSATGDVTYPLIPGKIVTVGLTPVSYTHLDVYKRQGLGSFGALPATGFRCRRCERSRQGFPKGDPR